MCWRCSGNRTKKATGKALVGFIRQKNLAIIRGGSSWGLWTKNSTPTMTTSCVVRSAPAWTTWNGNPLPSGCASMRWQRSSDISGNLEPDEYAHAYFLCWRIWRTGPENHASHAAIFSAAIRRYRHYGAANQHRTWHEVYVRCRKAGTSSNT